mgnify:FL=1|jgi:hypothetical protein
MYYITNVRNTTMGLSANTKIPKRHRRFIRDTLMDTANAVS